MSKKGMSVKNQNRIAKSVDPDEMACYELSIGSTLFSQQNKNIYSNTALNWASSH